jgi:hypothetical protein
MQIGCTTLGHSKVHGYITITNAHVIRNFDQHSPYQLSVEDSAGNDIPITDWMIPNSPYLDLAIGLIRKPLNRPFLRIAVRKGLVPRLQIWGILRQVGELIALDGRVISVSNELHQVVTNVGGAPGFSGTGYIDFSGSLSVVHAAAKGKESPIETSTLTEQISAKARPRLAQLQEGHTDEHAW